MDSVTSTCEIIKEVNHRIDCLKRQAAQQIEAGKAGKDSTELYKATIAALNSEIRLLEALLAEPETVNQTVERLQREMAK